MSVLRALFPTWGDVVAAAAWIVILAIYAVARFDEVSDQIDRILDDVFGSGR